MYFWAVGGGEVSRETHTYGETMGTGQWKEPGWQAASNLESFCEAAGLSTVREIKTVIQKSIIHVVTAGFWLNESNMSLTVMSLSRTTWTLWGAEDHRGLRFNCMDQVCMLYRNVVPQCSFNSYSFFKTHEIILILNTFKEHLRLFFYQ